MSFPCSFHLISKSRSRSKRTTEELLPCDARKDSRTSLRRGLWRSAKRKERDRRIRERAVWSEGFIYVEDFLFTSAARNERKKGDATGRFSRLFFFSSSSFVSGSFLRLSRMVTRDWLSATSFFLSFFLVRLRSIDEDYWRRLGTEQSFQSLFLSSSRYSRRPEKIKNWTKNFSCSAFSRCYNFLTKGECLWTYSIVFFRRFQSFVLSTLVKKRSFHRLLVV